MHISKKSIYIKQISLTQLRHKSRLKYTFSNISRFGLSSIKIVYTILSKNSLIPYIIFKSDISNEYF